MQKLLKIITVLFAYGSCFTAISQPSYAQIVDSSFYNWTVYEIQESELDYKKCYMVAHPLKSDSDHDSRLRPYIMITRFQRNRAEELSIYAGFELKTNSEVAMLVGDKQFHFFARGDSAWSKTKAEDVKVIETLLYYDKVKVRSDSAVGTYAVDEYSLKGITRAYARMREICR